MDDLQTLRARLESAAFSWHIADEAWKAAGSPAAGRTDEHARLIQTRAIYRDLLERSASNLAAALDPTPADRIEIKWRVPLDPAVYGYGSRIDRGGYCYGLFKGGRRIVGGTFGESRDPAGVTAYARKMAAEKGLAPDIPVLILEHPPS